MKQLKIGIVGDFNFTYNTHHATNLALDHAGRFLDLEISYYWIKISEMSVMRQNQLTNYDGFWIAPGPYSNNFYLFAIIDMLLQSRMPVFITGDSFKSLLDVLMNKYNLNSNGEKLISENLVEGNKFERVEIFPQSKEIISLYQSRNHFELTASRFSMYPQLISALSNEVLDIEAFNQFEEPEIISLKGFSFFVACGFCPQISSTREMPHPLIYTFMKACLIPVSQT
jgi:CTP synthase (UTP-ammonia lyase)